MPTYSPDTCPACGSEDLEDAGEVCEIRGDMATPVGYSMLCDCGAVLQVIGEFDGDREFEWTKPCPCGKREVKIFEDYAECEGDYVCFECQKRAAVDANRARTEVA